MSQAGASICTDCAEGTEANADKTQCGKFVRMSGDHIDDSTVM